MCVPFQTFKVLPSVSRCANVCLHVKEWISAKKTSCFNSDILQKYFWFKKHLCFVIFNVYPLYFKIIEIEIEGVEEEYQETLNIEDQLQVYFKRGVLKLKTDVTLHLMSKLNALPHTNYFCRNKSHLFDVFNNCWFLYAVINVHA